MTSRSLAIVAGVALGVAVTLTPAGVAGMVASDAGS